MGKTGSLKVCGNTALREGTIHMNPNDGFDLGLMTTLYEVDVVIGTNVDPVGYADARAAAATLHLKNEITNGEIHLSVQDTKRLADLKTVSVYRVDESAPRPKLIVTGS
ncbi:MAG: hypothetical protein ACLFNQ_10515 [Spirochaetaceae bacterium]